MVTWKLDILYSPKLLDCCCQQRMVVNDNDDNDGKAAGHDIVSLLYWDWGVSPYLPTNVLLTRPAPLFTHNFELNFDGV